MRICTYQKRIGMMLLPFQKAFALSYASISLTRLSSLVATPLSARKRCYKKAMPI
ncbi:Uncharacterised protein [Vibrio cholerae]|nr:Uncharacterised protein [Vibrio cholerae]